jgi:hypothetical protein
VDEPPRRGGMRDVREIEVKGRVEEEEERGRARRKRKGKKRERFIRGGTSTESDMKFVKLAEDVRWLYNTSDLPNIGCGVSDRTNLSQTEDLSPILHHFLLESMTHSSTTWIRNDTVEKAHLGSTSITLWTVSLVI